MIGEMKTATGRVISLIKETDGERIFEYASDLLMFSQCLLDMQIEVCLLFVPQIAVWHLRCLLQNDSQHGHMGVEESRQESAYWMDKYIVLSFIHSAGKLLQQQGAVKP